MYLDIRKHYREILQDELAQRIKQNSMYSLRAFAKDLGIYPSRLSDVLNGRYGLSRGAAIKIAQKLKYTHEEIACFCDLVDSYHARSKLEKSLAKKRLEQYQEKQQYNELSFDYFTIIKDWYHFAIVELTYLENFKSDITWIAKKLNLEKHLVEDAIERLFKVEMLENVNGQFKAVEDFTATTQDIPNKSLRYFHLQLMQKAQKAIEEQNVENRDVSAIVMAINKEKIKEAKQMIKSFRRDFDQFLCKDKNKNAVYSLGIQFYELTENT